MGQKRSPLKRRPMLKKSKSLKSGRRSVLRIRRDKLDILFSEYMRKKQNGICQKCLRQVGYAKLQVSHLFGRRYKALRWDEDNVSIVCFSCHLAFHESPVEHVAWFIRERGQAQYDMLMARSRNSGKDIDRAALTLYFQ